MVSVDASAAFVAVEAAAVVLRVLPQPARSRTPAPSSARVLLYFMMIASLIVNHLTFSKFRTAFARLRRQAYMYCVNGTSMIFKDTECSFFRIHSGSSASLFVPFSPLAPLLSFACSLRPLLPTASLSCPWTKPDRQIKIANYDCKTEAELTGNGGIPCVNFAPLFPKPSRS